MRNNYNGVLAENNIDNLKILITSVNATVILTFPGIRSRFIRSIFR